MKIAFGTVKMTPISQAVLEGLLRNGHEVDVVSGHVNDPEIWPDVGYAVGVAVAQGHYDQGVALCWTGHGVSIAANKVPGVRAAFCASPREARDARLWHHANVLALSLLPENPELMDATLKEWLHTDCGSGSHEQAVGELHALEDSVLTRRERSEEM